LNGGTGVWPVLCVIRNRRDAGATPQKRNGSCGGSKNPLRMKTGHQHLHHLLHRMAPIGRALMEGEGLPLTSNIRTNLASLSNTMNREIQNKIAEALSVFHGTLQPRCYLTAL